MSNIKIISSGKYIPKIQITNKELEAEKLVLDISTDGSIHPEEALKEAALKR